MGVKCGKKNKNIDLANVVILSLSGSHTHTKVDIVRFYPKNKKLYFA